MKHALQTRDPVCGMMVDIDDHAIRSTWHGMDYYFCASECRRSFEAEPAHYTTAAPRTEPPFTKKWGIVAPMFGSAGSGGAEYEPVPTGEPR